MSGYNNTFYEHNLPTVLLTAENILYDDSNTNLPASNVQEAIEALKYRIDTLIGLKVVPFEPNGNRVVVQSGKFRTTDGRKTIDFQETISPEFNPITTLPRIDLLCVDDGGNLTIVSGAENNLLIPPLYPVDRLTLAEIKIDETTEVIITGSDIRNCKDLIGPSTTYIIDGGTF